MNILRLFFLLLTVCALAACHDDEEQATSKKLNRAVVFINSLNGPGDNGYNDIILEEEMYFIAVHPNVEAHMYLPDNMQQAESMYKTMISLPIADSILIVLNGSEYGDMVRMVGNIIEDGIQVLLFEDDGIGLPNGVTSFNIQRYGASYVAGRMSSKVPALVIAAMSDNDQIDDAVKGFLDGYSVEGDYKPFVHYLSDDVEGFDAPGQALLVCDSIMRRVIPEEVRNNKFDVTTSPGLCVFPLAGGSNTGIYSYVNALPGNWNVYAIGMDKDYCNISPNIPFSIIIPLNELLSIYLNAWIDNDSMPSPASYGLSGPHCIRFAVNPYIDDEFIDEQLEQFIIEAEEKEKEYVRMKSEK